MAKQMAAVVDSLDGVDEALKEYYELAQDGKYILNQGRPRGFTPDDEVKQFRDNNTTLTTQNAELTSKLAGFDGVNVEQYNTWKAAQDDLDSKALIKAGDIDGLVNAAVKKALDPVSAELSVEKTARQETQAKLDAAIVDTKVISAASDFGKIRSGAGDVIVTKAKAAGWQNVDGSLLQMSSDNVVIGRDIKEWIASTGAKDGEINFCFEPSVGGGGDGADGKEGVQGGAKTLEFGDTKGFSENLEDIASGKTVVAPPQR
tara:strand:- start:230 stop:1009 length:780 start_codon:yes stop_codon:yes gene_type:complete